MSAKKDIFPYYMSTYRESISMLIWKIEFHAQKQLISHDNMLSFVGAPKLLWNG